MNTEQFLRRVIAPGNYAILAYNMEPWLTANARWGYRAFALDDLPRMAEYAAWCTSKRWDTYAALAAFTVAQPKGGEHPLYADGSPKLQAARKQNNVQYLKTLFVDLDVKRDGDKKNAASVFATRGDALRWLFTFCGSVPGMKRPNLLIDSGYGYHAYWVFDPPLQRPQWDILAGALKEAMLQNGFVGDAGISIDSARILRPPGTVNYKGDKDTLGCLVASVDKVTLPDYDVVDLQNALTPYVGLQVQAQGGSTSTSASASVSALGARPTFMGALPQPSTNQAAQAAMPRSEYLFAEIVTKCQQVATSLQAQGNGDLYPLWYRCNLTLLHFCADGANYTHEISKGDPKYTQAETDKAVIRIAGEVLKSSALGAPKCVSYNDHRRGICDTCPHFGRINSPISLGRPNGDLPTNYRRERGQIERLVVKPETNEWVPLLTGDVYAAQLERLPGAAEHALSFTYELGGSKELIHLADAKQLNSQQLGAIAAYQGIPLYRNSIVPFRDFAMAWMTKLRLERNVREGTYRPFGWCHDKGGQRIGLAIAGTLYRTNATIEAVGGGDAVLNSFYRPHGSMANWRKAAALFEGPNARQDLHAIMAISFGSPLISLVGDVRGMSWHFWSIGSAVGKTSMMKVAQAVWSDARAMSTMDDTPNAVMRSLSGPRVLPRLWDEARVPRIHEAQFSALVYSIPQGREKARMGPDTMLRETGEWSAMVLFTSNRSLMDLVVDNSQGTDSGMARLFEVHMPPGNVTFSGGAGQALALVETNFGHAGREFAAFVAANLPTVQAYITNMTQAITVQWRIEAEERFYVAGCVAALAGARFAKELGLFDFDLKALYVWMHREFMTLRQGRRTTSSAAPGGAIDVEQILTDYTSAMASYKLVTNHPQASKPPTGVGGRPHITHVSHAPPLHINEVRWQILMDQMIIRLDLGPFRAWLRENRHGVTATIKEMEQVWGAVQGKRTMGAGTPFSGGQTKVLDIPLTVPALAGYRYVSPKSNSNLGAVI